MRTLDLNCDMGEGFSIYQAGDDIALLDHVSSANVACGFHAGDPRNMGLTVRAAAARGVSVGAHPSFPDLQGFGRREMTVSPTEAYDMIVYQIGALQAFAKVAGVSVRHVKAHGALYNMAAKDEKLADAMARAVRDVDASLVMFGLAGSAMIGAGRAVGLSVASEVFADRSYQDDGSLTSRKLPGAMITDVDQSIAQVIGMVRDGYVRTASGKEVAVRADTLCVHGDQPGALAFAKALRAALAGIGVTVQAPSTPEVTAA